MDFSRRGFGKLLALASGFMMIPSHYPEVSQPEVVKPGLLNPRWNIYAIDGLSVHRFDRQIGPPDLNGPIGFTENDLEFLANVETDQVRIEARWDISRAYLARKPIVIHGDYLRAGRMDIFMSALRDMIAS